MSAFPMRRRRVLWGLGALACAPLSAMGAASELPGESIYRLRDTLVDQDGRTFGLSSMRGHAVLASMFYSSCEMVCPMIFETIHQTLKALPAAEAKAVKVLMISFDPARDSVPVLKKIAQQHSCDARWTLARSNESSVRTVAAALGVQYRRLASGEFNHSSTLELLDTEGRITARSGVLGAVDPALVAAVHRASM